MDILKDRHLAEDALQEAFLSIVKRLGDNSEMSPLYEEMQGFAKDLGYEIQERFFEYYLNDSEYGTDKLLTKVVMLLQ